MTPQHFQDVALAWISVITVVAIAIAVAAGRIWEAISNIKARQDRHGQQLTSLIKWTPGQAAQMASEATQSSPVAVSPPAAPVDPYNPLTDPKTAGQYGVIVTTAPKLVPPAGMTEQEAIAANVSMQSAEPDAAPLPGGISQELPAGAGGTP